jgi:ketosteroid isomerase-like protein
MSEENVALLRGLYEEWGKGNLEPGTDHYSADAVFEPIAEGREAFDVEGFQRFMRGFVAQWDGFRMVAEEFVDLGDKVLVTERQYATGKRSGIETEQTDYAIWSFRDGVITGARWELDPDEAKRAAGVTD